jgi:hypothetical protein
MSEDHGSRLSRAADIEARLRDALAKRAGGDPVADADWGDLAGRLASSTHRRQRVLAAAAALALVVGAAGGYLGETAASPTVAARTGSGSSARGVGSPKGSSALAPSAAIPGVMCPDGSGAATSGPIGAPSTDIGSASRLFIRTTPDGVTIRVYQDAPTAVSTCSVLPTPSGGSGSGTSSSAGSGANSSTGASPPTLTPVAPTASDTTVELSDDDAVGEGALSAPLCIASPGQGATGTTGNGAAGVVSPPVITPATTPATTPTTPLPPMTPTPAVTSPTTVSPPPASPPTTTPQSEPQELSTGTFGVAEGDPVWWVAVEVGPDVTSVQMTFPDGVSDQMAPVDGIAVLAHRVSAAVASASSGPDVVRGTLEVLGSAGSVVATVPIPQQSTPPPGPTPVPLNEGTPSVSPGVIVACPPSSARTPQAQSSGTTEKR